jgi:hypothetical protein
MADNKWINEAIGTIRKRDANVDDPNMNYGVSQAMYTRALAEAAIAQALAAERQAAALERIATAIEALQDSDSLAESVRIWGSGT